MPSPLLYDGILYLLKTQQRAPVGVRRQDRQAALSGAAAGRAAERLRVAGRRRRPRLHRRAATGTTLVLRHGPTFEVLAKNTLDDGFDASPALVDGEIYLRGYRTCTASPPSRQARPVRPLATPSEVRQLEDS